MNESATPTTTARDMRPPRFLEGFWVVFGWALRRNFGRMRFFVSILLSAGIGVLLGYNALPKGAFVTDDTRYYELWKLLDGDTITFLVPLVALIFVAQGFSREISQRTLVYYLVRPVSRATVFLANYVAGVVPGIVVASVGLLALVISTGTELPASVFEAVVAVSVFGIICLGALYYLLSALFKHGLIAGLAYTFVFEVLLGQVRGGSKASVTYHLRSLTRGLIQDDFTARSERLRDALAPPPAPRTVDEMVETAMTSAREVVYETPTVAIVVMLGITIVALAIGAWRTSVRDFPLKD